MGSSGLDGSVVFTATHHFQLLLHLAGDLDRLLAHLLHGEYPPLVDADLRVNHGISKVSVGIRAEGDLAGPHDWLRRRLCAEIFLCQYFREVARFGHRRI